MNRKEEVPEENKRLILAIAAIVKKRREEKGMSQEAFATALECSLTYVKRMERGDVNFRLNTLVALCEVLELSSLNDLVPIER